MEEDRIVKKALEMYFKYGIRSVTMDDFCREMGISKRTLYEFIDNKQELVRRTVDYQLNLQIENSTQIKEDSENAVEELFNLSKMITSLLRKLSPNVIYDLNKYYGEIWKERQKLQWEEMWKSVEDNIKRGINEGLYRSDFNVDIIVFTHVSRALTLLEENQMVEDLGYSWVEVFEETFDYHIHGIASPKGLEIWKKLKE